MFLSEHILTNKERVKLTSYLLFYLAFRVSIKTTLSKKKYLDNLVWRAQLMSFTLDLHASSFDYTKYGNPETFVLATEMRKRLFSFPLNLRESGCDVTCTAHAVTQVKGIHVSCRRIDHE